MSGINTAINSTTMLGAVPRAKVQFSREQYEALNKMFPEFVGTAHSTESERTFYAGQRQVIAAIKERVQG